MPKLAMPPPLAGRVVGDGGVGDDHRARFVVDAAAAGAGRVVGDGGVGDGQRASMLSMPPPKRAEPFEIVRPVIVAVTPPETENTPTALLPLTVSRFAPGPLITSGPAVSERVSVLESVMVCGVPKTVGSNSITLPSVFGLALAWSMQ